MTDQGGKTGFYDGKGMAYFDNSGFQAKNAFIKYAGNYYYFDKEGYMLTGRQDIDGKTYFFLPNGIQLRDSIYQSIAILHQHESSQQPFLQLVRNNGI